MTIAPFNYARQQQVARGMIEKFGVNAVLRRQNAPDRPCKVVIQEYTAIERIGKMIDPVDRLALVSPFDPTTGLALDPDPSSELDRLVTMQPGTTNVEDETLRIVAPPGKLAPGNIIDYWELRVRR